jgi:predicted permease
MARPLQLLLPSSARFSPTSAHFQGRQPITVIVSFIIAIIPPLKALFVPLTHEDGTPIIAFAPDGAPPLSFLLDTTTFLGNASVPLGLVCIGAALAKLKIPKGVKDLPLGAITALAFGRQILQPVVAVFMIQGLVRVGVINGEDKVLRFIVM